MAWTFRKRRYLAGHGTYYNAWWSPDETIIVTAYPRWKPGHWRVCYVEAIEDDPRDVEGKNYDFVPYALVPAAVSKKDPDQLRPGGAGHPAWAEVFARLFPEDAGVYPYKPPSRIVREV